MKSQEVIKGRYHIQYLFQNNSLKQWMKEKTEGKLENTYR